MITLAQLDSWLGKNIRDICLNGYDTQSHNHCAHFVSHVLNLDFGYTCRRHVGGSHLGGNLRVHEIFAQCPATSEIQQCTTDMTGLVFVSSKSSFVTRRGTTTLQNVKNKHIGIILGGVVWHYSNALKFVNNEPMSAFLFHYQNQTNALWHGTLPTNSRPIWYGQC